MAFGPAAIVARGTSEALRSVAVANFVFLSGGRRYKRRYTQTPCAARGPRRRDLVQGGGVTTLDSARRSHLRLAP